jgi:hypothetical protein
MGHICRRCTNSFLGTCKKGLKKTDNQIKNEKYSCFSERYFQINKIKHDPDSDYVVYVNEITKKQALFLKNVLK